MPRALAGLLFALAAGPAAAQAPPRLSTVFPAGGRAGTVVPVTVTGVDLTAIGGVRFTHPGLTARLAPPDPKAKVGTAVNLMVTIAAGVEPGQYDVRLVGQLGVSNPRLFAVGTRPEVREAEPNDDAVAPEPAGGLLGGGGMIPRAGRPLAQRISLGTVVNGVIASATDVDYTVFAGRAGDRVLAHCAASSIESRARPQVEIFDAAGRRLASGRNYAGADALADATLPADGDYFVRLSEFAYIQGGPEATYRLTVAVMPWIDAVDPPAVPVGQPVPVTLYGRNLPGGKPTGMQVDGRPIDALTVTVTPPTDPAAGSRFPVRGFVPPVLGLQDAFEFRLPGGNAIPITLTDLPVVMEGDGPNDTPGTAEELKPPCEVAGRIGRPGDRDWYTFATRPGEPLVVELLGERAGAVADLGLRVRTDKDIDLAGDLDDDADALHPVTFLSRSLDPPAFTLTPTAATGRVRVLVAGLDSAVSYGPRAGYRLRVRPPAPDFRAVVIPRSRDLPAAVTLAPGGSAAVDVLVHRRDGFNGLVHVSAAGLPTGVTAAPAFVGTGCRYGTLVLTAAPTAADFTGSVAVTATATIRGKPVIREARPAGLIWSAAGQPTDPAHVRLEQELMLAVRPAAKVVAVALDPVTMTVKGKAGGDKPQRGTADGVPTLFVRPGDTITVPVRVKAASATTLALEAIGPGAVGLAPFKVPTPPPPAKDKPVELVVDVQADAAPGTYALAVRAEVGTGKTPRPKGQPPAPCGYAAPVAVTVLPATLAKLATTTPAGGKLKAGAPAEVVVTVARQADYAGPFTVRLTLPAGRGVTAADATIPAGADSARVTLTADADATPGPLPVGVTVTGTVHERVPIAHETRLTLTVTK